MAKVKKQKSNKAGHPFIGTAGGLHYYINDAGEITDESAKPVGTGYQKVLLQQFAPPEPKESKETLEEAFPETYEEPRKKKRTYRKKNTDVEQKEAAEKLATDLARDVQDLKDSIGSLAALMKEDLALIRQQLTTQQRSVTLLTEIAKNITSGGGGGALSVPSITSGFGWKGMLAAVLGGLALGGIGGYFLNDYLSKDNEEDSTDAAELVPEQQEQPQQTAGIQEAQQRGEQKAEILNIDARELAFNSDKLSFEVNELTIDADNIKTEGKPGAGSTSGGGGGGGPSGPTGSVGGSAATGAAAGAFNPNVQTPEGPSGVPGQTVKGGAGAFQGFSGKSPTPESVKEDLVKTDKFTLQTDAGDLKGLIDQSAAAAGIDPRTMYGIVAGESLHRNTYDVGDNGKSFGPFQLFTGGGLGNDFQKETGLNPADPKTIPAQAKWVANYLAKHPNMNIKGTWHGYNGNTDWNPSWGKAGYEGLEKLKATNKKTKAVEVPSIFGTGSGMLGESLSTPVLKPVRYEKISSTSVSEFGKLDSIEAPTTAASQPQVKPNTTVAPEYDIKGNISTRGFSATGSDRGDGVAELAARKADMQQPEPPAPAPVPEPPAPTAPAVTPEPEPEKQIPLPPRRPPEFSTPASKPQTRGKGEQEIRGFQQMAAHVAFAYLFGNLGKKNHHSWGGH